eukprot:4099400-Pyramimonas_sp.AAC.1
MADRARPSYIFARHVVRTPQGDVFLLGRECQQRKIAGLTIALKRIYSGLHPHSRGTSARVIQSSRRGVGYMQYAVNLPPPQEIGLLCARLDSPLQTNPGPAPCGKKPLLGPSLFLSALRAPPWRLLTTGGLEGRA